MHHSNRKQEAHLLEEARELISCPRWNAEGGAPDYPDPPDRRDDDDDEEDEGGYPGINRPEMPATDRESTERPEKAPNPLNEPGQ